MVLLPVQSLIAKESFQFQNKRIIIDAAYGGKEKGLVSPLGYFEKDITLKAGQELAKKLEKKGFTVIFTRKADYQLDLDSRAKIASRYGGDLFITIYLDDSDNINDQGLRVYFYAPELSSSVLPFLERNRLLDEKKDEIRFNFKIEPEEICHLFTYQFFNQKSGYVASKLSRRLNVRKRSPIPIAFSAPIKLLRMVNMPGILIVLGFVSNPEDEAIFTNESKLNNLCLILCEEICKLDEK